MSGHAHLGMDDMDDMDMDMDMTMTMYFYSSHKVKFLFESFDVKDSTGYFGVCLVSFIIGFTTETLSIVQDKMDQKISSDVRENKQKKRSQRLQQGLVFLFRMFFSYLCMLAVMTYNVGILLCVTFGLAAAYFILGFSPAEVIVVANNCLKDQNTAYH